MYKKIIPILFPLLFIHCSLGANAEKVEKPADQSSGAAEASKALKAEAFIKIGPAVPVSRTRGVVPTLNSKGEGIILAWLMGKGEGDNFSSLLALNVDTGKSQQLWVDGWDAPFSFLLTSSNLLYALFNGQFFEFDPETLSFTLIKKVEQTHAFSLLELPDGKILMGTFPDAHFYVFDPATDEIKDYGSILDVNWRTYIRSLAYDKKGWWYAGIGVTESAVVAFNPTTGEKKKIQALNPSADLNGMPYVRVGVNGEVFGNYPNEDWQLLNEGNATPYDKKMPALVKQKTGTQDTILKQFPDGRTLVEFNTLERYYRISSAEDSGETKKIPFDYKTGGARVYILVRDQEKHIYGGTGHPLRFFKMDHQTGEIKHYGLDGYNGHFNDAIIVENELYAGLYSSGTIVHYDLAAPIHGSKGINPRVLTERDPIVGRPHAIIASPDKRYIYMGGTPGYGKTGGGLVIWDRQTSSVSTILHEALPKWQSIMALKSLADGRLVFGTTTAPGTSGEQLAKAASVGVLDPVEKKLIHSFTITPDQSAIKDIMVDASGKVHGLTINGIYFVYDPKANILLHQENLAKHYGYPAGMQGPRILFALEDKTIVAVFQNNLVEISPETYKHALIAPTPESISVSFVGKEGEVIMAAGPILWKTKLYRD